MIHPDDRQDFEIGKGSLWVSERVSWRRELALALGYGCGGVERAEVSVSTCFFVTISWLGLPPDSAFGSGLVGRLDWLCWGLLGFGKGG
jgi:hypothetical protein